MGRCWWCDEKRLWWQRNGSVAMVVAPWCLLDVKRLVTSLSGISSDFFFKGVIGDTMSITTCGSQTFGDGTNVADTVWWWDKCCWRRNVFGVILGRFLSAPFWEGWTTTWILDFWISKLILIVHWCLTFEMKSMFIGKGDALYGAIWAFDLGQIRWPRLPHFFYK